MKLRCMLVTKIKKILPEIIVILLCMVILGVGVSRKEGYHMDELLSFQLSNAEYNPWIVPTQPEGRLAKFVHNEIDGENLRETMNNLVDTVLDVLQNRGRSKLLSYQADVYEEPVWITAEEFKDYVTVDDKDDFNYLSVYFNVKDDNHPPVHFMLLHTISSLFQGRVQPYVGCVINMAAVAVTMAVMMKLGIILAEILCMDRRGRFLGIFAALLYGISTGALASVLLIRMYCLLTMFSVSLLYIHLKKWRDSDVTAEENDKSCGFARENKALIAVTVLGFLTQYFFLFYCIVLALVTAVLLLWHKRTKELFIYIRSMIIAAAIGLVCFPFAISDVLASERGVEALDNLSSGLAGYGTRVAAFWNILEKRTFGTGLIVVVVAGLIGVIVICAKRQGINVDNRRRMTGAMWMLLLPVTGYFFLVARMAPYLVDRYIMPIFPLVMLIGAVGLICLVHYVVLKTRNRIIYLVCGVTVALQVFGLSQYDGSYLYTGYEKQLELAEEYADYHCICVYEGVGYYENLLEFTCYEETLLLTEAELAERSEVNSVREHEKIVVLLKEEVDRENVCRILNEKYGLTYEKDIFCDSVYGDRVLVFSTH